MALGLPANSVKLVPYSPQWVRLFEEEAQRLREVLGPYIVDVQHIGSTAVPGILAKPILDIAVALKNISDIEECIVPLKALGYVYQGEQEAIKGWHFFTKGQDEVKTHHLHVVEWSSDFWVTRILFRDYLRSRRDAAEEYVKIKQELADEFSEARSKYTEGKSNIIEQITERAKQMSSHSD